MEKLSDFYFDKHMREAVKKSLSSFLEEEIIKTVLKGNDVKGYKEAKDVYSKWESHLAKKFKQEDIQKEPEFFNAE